MMRLARRQFLRVSALATTVAAATACTPTAAPPEVGEATLAPAEATVAPGEAPTVTTVATSTAAAAAKYGESPATAALVAQGDLPSVDERLPKEPLVVTPVHEVGQYGGEWKTVTTGSTYQEWYSLFEPLNTFTQDFTGLVPNLAKAWEFGEEGKVVTITLREGVRWSDGEPFTADDIMYWWEDVILNDELTPTKPSAFMRAGELAKLEKVDDYTVRVTFSQSNGMFEELLPNQWMYQPAHYMKQFHAKHAGEDELKAAMAQEGFDTWTDLYGAKAAMFNNPGSPYLTAWVVENTVDQQVHLFGRNAYYWKVDTDGNQLPYLDGKQRTLVSDAEAALLKAISGEVDFEWHSAPGGLANRPVVVENRERSAYHIVELVNPGTGYGSIFFNYHHTDPVLKELFNDLDFRIALSIAINRDEINDLLYKGLAHVGQVTAAVGSPWYDEAYSLAYTEYDPDQANAMLDSLGLSELDSDGYRLRSDGKRLSLVNAAFTPWPAENVDIQELVKGYWDAIGIEVIVKPMESQLWVPYVHGLSHDLASYAGNLGFSGNPPVLREGFCTAESNQHWAPQWGLWYQSSGQEGEEPPEDIKKLQGYYEEVLGEVSAEKRIELQREALALHAKNLWMLGIVAEPDAGRYGVCRDDFGNVPDTGYPTQPPQVVPTAQFYRKG